MIIVTRRVLGGTLITCADHRDTVSVTMFRISSDPWTMRWKFPIQDCHMSTPPARSRMNIPPMIPIHLKAPLGRWESKREARPFY